MSATGRPRAEKRLRSCSRRNGDRTDEPGKCRMEFTVYGKGRKGWTERGILPCGRAPHFTPSGLGIMHFQDVQFLDAARRAQNDGIAFTSLDQRTCDWRDPADASLQWFGLVHPDDRHTEFLACAVRVDDRGTEKNLVTIGLKRRIHDLSDLQPARQEADAAIDFAQTFLAVQVIAVLRTVPV